MNNKQRIKQKQLAKKQAKAEKERIITNYMVKIEELLDNRYLELHQAIETFKEDLVNGSVVYDTLKIEIMNAIQQDDADMFEQIADKAINLEKDNKLLKTITSHDDPDHPIFGLLKQIAKDVTSILEGAMSDLNDNPNCYYITSLLMNRCENKLQEYNAYIIDIGLESNTYIDIYIESRESFIDYITQIKDDAYEKLTAKCQESVETIKYKERLRVNYYELENFLTHKGYECVRQTSTTHAIWKNKESGLSIPVPNKSGTVPQGTVSKILRLINSNRQELAQYLYE